MLPASTSTLCVLPLRTNGRSHFSLDTEPMPAALVGRLAEPEYHAIVQRINAAVQPLTHFGLTSLLLPFLAVDVLAVALLYGLDPAVLVTATTYDLPDMLQPMLLEAGLLLLAFPMVSFFVARRVEAVQTAAKAVLDDVARKYAARGVHFSLKLGVHAAGAASNMWMETQVAPLFRVLTPVPVPTIVPILLPSAHHAAPAPPRTPPPSARASGKAVAPRTPTPGSAALPSTPSSMPPLSPLTPAASGADATAPTTDGATGAAGSSSDAGAGEGAQPSLLAQEVAQAAEAGTLTAQQQEYLRVLQENQLLRQYLAQMQTLVQLQSQHASALASQQAAT